jgi:hypothetical protein
MATNQKVEKIELPSSIDQVISMVSRLMFSQIHRITMDIDNNAVDVRWSPTHEDDALMREDESVDIREVFDRVRIKEENVTMSCDSQRLARIAMSIQELAADKRYPLVLVTNDVSSLKEWLGFPKIASLESLFGIPVKEFSELEEGSIYLVAGKFRDSPIRTATTIKKIVLDPLPEGDFNESVQEKAA